MPYRHLCHLQKGNIFLHLTCCTHTYNPTQLEENTRKYLTINTHQGLYGYTQLHNVPLGVVSAPAIFQKYIHTVLQRLDSVICYLYGVLVIDQSETEHLENVQKHGIRVKRNKCAFMRESVQYLGHQIDAQVLHATDDKIKAIMEAPVLKNVQQTFPFVWLPMHLPTG